MSIRFIVSTALFSLFFFYQSYAQTLAKADSVFGEEQYDKALELYNEALVHTNKLADFDLGNLYLRSGICFKELNQYKEAIQRYFDALQVFERIKEPGRIAAACTNIAAIYSIQKDLYTAEKFLLRANELFFSLNDSAKVAFVLNDLALVYSETNRYDKAIVLHTKAINEYGNVMDEPLLEKHLFNKGNCYETSNQDSSLHYYLQAETVAAETGDSAMLSVIYNSIGDVYKEKRDFQKAISFFNKSLSLNEKFGEKEELAVIYRNLTDLYDSTRQYEKAYSYACKEREINEDLFNSEKTKFATELSEKYESGKKDEKIKSQDVENKLKGRNLILSLTGLGLAVALAAFSFISYRRKQKVNLALQQQNIRIEKLNKELDTSNQVKSKLFSVISHDIRGPISSIYAYLQMQNITAKNDQNTAFSKQTEQLLDTLEDLLVWSKSQLHQFSPTMEQVQLQSLVIQISALLQPVIDEKKILVENAISPGQFLNTDLNMLTIILRNVIGNAVKYAVPGTTITINALKQAPNMYISISNQADDSHSAALYNAGNNPVSSNASGLGTTLIREFAEKLHGHVEYTEKENLVTSTLLFPL